MLANNRYLNDSNLRWFLTLPTTKTLTIDGKEYKILCNFDNSMAEKKFGWTTQFQIMRPGVYGFELIPTEEWVAAEDKYQEDTTKLMEPVFGQNGNWTVPDGFQNGVLPLSDPFGASVNSIFRGKAVLNGEPAANKLICVEFYNPQGYDSGSRATKIVHLLKTDRDGKFSFQVPWAGWWGFVLLEDLNSLRVSKSGEPINIGGVVWTKFIANE